MTTERAQRPDTDVVIVGAGFGGIAMAVELSRAGIGFVILERASDMGGVWRENTYPGAGCDVPSPLYSFSFARNPHWPRRYAGQSDIHAYLSTTAQAFGITEHISFGTDVASAEFDASAGCWQVHSTAGARWVARGFVPATGQLSRPAFPPIPGIESFSGVSFHSAEWNHDVELHDRRVAVLGTGASAVQFVPRIQPRARRLDVFQRSAPHILRKRDHPYKRWHHRLFELCPAIQRLDRLGFWLYAELAQQSLSAWQWLVPLFRRRARRHLRESVPDPSLRKKLTPDYEIGCKRVLFSNDYLPALTQDNVDVVADSVAEITPRGVRTAHGTEYPADVIIYATGFAASELLAPMRITGTDGARLAERFSAGARAYLGMSVPDFPNMFVLYGPNTNLGGGSVIYMLECQARYVRQAMQHILAVPERCVDVRRDVEARWDREIQGRLERSVWSRCSSWYRNAYGRVVSIWPGRTLEYRRRTRRFDPRDYREHTASRTSASPTAEPSCRNANSATQ